MTEKSRVTLPDDDYTEMDMQDMESDGGSINKQQIFAESAMQSVQTVAVCQMRGRMLSGQIKTSGPVVKSPSPCQADSNIAATRPEDNMPNLLPVDDCSIN